MDSDHEKNTDDVKEEPRGIVLLLAGLVLVYAIVLVRTAWVSDDAQITLRVVDNFFNGYGLRWNVLERVQAYTHPLWLFILAVVSFFSQEYFYSTLAASIELSILAAMLLSKRIAINSYTAAVCMMILIMSRAFVDYSTSGLENPMTHLLLCIFCVAYFRVAKQESPRLRDLLFLAFIAALAFTNRHDSALIYIWPLLYLLKRCRFRPKAILMLFLGGIPAFSWLAFSLFYYGAPFPNTYYAKVHTGIPLNLLVRHGVLYYKNCLSWDPLTLAAIFLSFIPILRHPKRFANVLPLSLGLGLYLLYILRIGGDFMAGRFFATPLLLAVIIISQFKIRGKGTAFLICLVVIIGFCAPVPTILSDSTYHAQAKEKIPNLGHPYICDERAWYYENFGLLPRVSSKPLFPMKRNTSPIDPATTNFRVSVTGGIGRRGFSGGPEVHWIDMNALADPLLARLPTRDPEVWRIGHFGRDLPSGYYASVVGENRINDPHLKEYYDVLRLITRGDLWDMDRLKAIALFNLGSFDHLRQSYLETTQK